MPKYSIHEEIPNAYFYPAALLHMYAIPCKVYRKVIVHIPNQDKNRVEALWQSACTFCPRDVDDMQIQEMYSKLESVSSELAKEREHTLNVTRHANENNKKIRDLQKHYNELLQINNKLQMMVNQMSIINKTVDYCTDSHFESDLEQRSYPSLIGSTSPGSSSDSDQ